MRADIDAMRCSVDPATAGAWFDPALALQAGMTARAQLARSSVGA